VRGLIACWATRYSIKSCCTSAANDGGWGAVIHACSTFQLAVNDSKLDSVNAPEMMIVVTQLSAGEFLDSAEFRKRAGITRQALRKAVASRRMFYLEAGGIRANPAFCLADSLERSQVETGTKLLGDLSGGSKWLFFTTVKGSLAKPDSGRARTPVQALVDGDFEKVKRTATGYAER